MIAHVAIAITALTAAVWLTTDDIIVTTALPDSKATIDTVVRTSPNIIRIGLQILLIAIGCDQIVRVIRTMIRSESNEEE